jgi:hypothetical protein
MRGRAWSARPSRQITLPSRDDEADEPTTSPPLFAGA